jgi:hypothetical protein
MHKRRRTPNNATGERLEYAPTDDRLLLDVLIANLDDRRPPRYGTYVRGVSCIRDSFRKVAWLRTNWYGVV